MQVYKTKGFARFARREGIGDGKLCDAVARAERGLIDADLSGGVIKQRLPRDGQGRSGGYRVIIFYRTATRSIFIDGFAKSDEDNIGNDDLKLFRELAFEYLAYRPAQVKALLKAGEWIEVRCDA